MTIEALMLGGLIGYAIGLDGKIQPVTMEQMIKLLRDSKPEFIKKVDIDTSIARTGNERSGKYDIAGSFIIVLNPTTPTTTVYLKPNEPSWPELPISGSTGLRRIAGPFYRFFIKNAAGAGTLTLIVARHYQFQFSEGEVSVASVEHGTTHQDGGADEISVIGLSGLLADDQHVLDAEVLAVAATLLHASRHIPGGADPMRWTAGKLLRGAGAGADPTEIDVPSATVATGTYTGNAGAARQIAVGFKVSYVVIIRTVTSYGMWHIHPSYTIKLDNTGVMAVDTANCYDHATDGFVVDNAGNSNILNDIYYYFAISE